MLIAMRNLMASQTDSFRVLKTTTNFDRASEVHEWLVSLGFSPKDFVFFLVKDPFVDKSSSNVLFAFYRSYNAQNSWLCVDSNRSGNFQTRYSSSTENFYNTYCPAGTEFLVIPIRNNIEV